MAAPDRKFTIAGMSRVMSPDPKRNGRWDRIVAYTTTDGHGATVLLPDETVSEDTIRAAILADLEDRAKWLHKSFRL